jgi:hypothetical protein
METGASERGGVHLTDFDVTVELEAGTTLYQTIPLQTHQHVRTLATIFSSVVITRAHCRAVQVNLADGRIINSNGHVYFGIVPSVKNTAVTVGHSARVIGSVRRRHVLPLSENQQVVVEAEVPVDGYETDLVCDPRRGAGVVLWQAHTGITPGTTTTAPNRTIATFTWTICVECSGKSVVW